MLTGSATADARALAVVRITVGVATVVKAALVHPLLAGVADGSLLRLPLVEALPAPPAGTAGWLAAAWAVAGLALAVGWRHRVWAVACAAFPAYLLALDQQLYGNHLYLLACVAGVLALVDAGATWAPGRPRVARVPAWQVWPLRTQASVVYLFSALTKLNATFLSGAVVYAEMPPALRGWPLWVYTMAAVAAVIVELLLAVGLWTPGLRRAAAIAGVGLHATIAVLMSPTLELVVFAAVMISLYPSFWAVGDRSATAVMPDRWLHRA